MYRFRGQTFLQKKNECYSYKPIKIDTCEALKFFLDNFNTIINDIILPNAYIDKKGDTAIVVIDHQCITEMFLSKGSEKKEIIIEAFRLYETSGFTEGDKNINYNHNATTKTIQLCRLLGEKSRKQKFKKQ